MYINLPEPLTTTINPFETVTTTIGTGTVPCGYPPISPLEEWEEEIVTIKRRRRVRPYTPPTQIWPYTPVEPCVFDNLPPGTYGLVCTCPRHRVIC